MNLINGKEYIEVQSGKYIALNCLNMTEKYAENKLTCIVDINREARFPDIKKYENILLNINTDNNFNIKDSVWAIKKIWKLFKVCKKNKVNIGVKDGENIVIGNICFEKDIDSITQNIINPIKALRISNTRQRYEYIYDEVCDYLDVRFIKQNQCEFKNDICIEKQKCKKITNLTTMGCCHRCKNQYLGIILFQKFELCKYLKDKTCTIRSLSCKLYTCDTLKAKGRECRINDIVMLNVFLNNVQKFILKVSVYKTKDETVDRLMNVRFLI